jgi:hypothetical protein
MPDDSTPVQEAEIIDSSPTAADTVVDLTGLINSHISQLEVIRHEVSELKEMLNSIFENDSTYQMHDAAVKEATKVRGNTKKQILKLPQAADLTNRIQNTKSHMKELNDALSGYLQDYARSTGATQFETEDGQVREIVYVAKLVKREPKFGK